MCFVHKGIHLYEPLTKFLAGQIKGLHLSCIFPPVGWRCNTAANSWLAAVLK
jgi:hypothetical protein